MIHINVVKEMLYNFWVIETHPLNQPQCLSLAAAQSSQAEVPRRSSVRAAAGCCSQTAGSGGAASWR